MLGIENQQPFGPRYLTQRFVGSDEVVNQTATSQVESDGQLQRIQSPDPAGCCVFLDQARSSIIMALGDRNHAKPLGSDIAVELSLEQLSLVHRDCSSTHFAGYDRLDLKNAETGNKNGDVEVE